MNRTDRRDDEWPSKLSQPARRALAGAGYTRLEQLTQVTEAELVKLHGMGPKAIVQLRETLASRGLAFGSKPGVPVANDSSDEQRGS